MDQASDRRSAQSHSLDERRSGGVHCCDSAELKIDTDLD
jgi:hypothetical protein